MPVLIVGASPGFNHEADINAGRHAQIIHVTGWSIPGFSPKVISDMVAREITCFRGRTGTDEPCDRWRGTHSKTTETNGFHNG